MHTLRKRLLALDGRGYKAYKAIAGRYAFPGFTLSIDHVQGDPFATPSRISVRLPMGQAALPAELWRSPVRRLALEDFLARCLRRAIRRHVKGQRGSGNSGEMRVAGGGQQVLQRNAVLISEDHVEARLTLGLPARGRRAAGREAIAMFFDELPAVVQDGLCFAQLDANAAARHVHSVEDQQYLRDWLRGEDLVAFVADGAVLPRASGVDDRPLAEGALPWHAPDSLARRVDLPNAGEVRGLGIPAGVSLIVGGGFHGKSTLLQTLERGVYDHIPGDGRERVASLADAVKIRAEDGRAIHAVDISPFINHLPFGRDTTRFSSENASGSTSQAANIVEALACGSRLLLIDEDTSATNFMIRDARMQALVADDKEPITPLVQRVRDLYTQLGVSSIIVMGGSGDYLDVADTVIMMDNYAPRDVTDKARALARPLPPRPAAAPFDTHPRRCPGPRVLDASRGRRAVKIDVRETHLLDYGEHRIDLGAVEQLVDRDQTRTIGLMIHYFAEHGAEDCETLAEGLRQVMHAVERHGLDCLSPFKVGNLALPRLFELAAAINRIREGEWR